MTSARGVRAGPAQHTEGAVLGEGVDVGAGGEGDGVGTGVGGEGSTGAVAAAGEAVAGWRCVSRLDG